MPLFIRPRSDTLDCPPDAPPPRRRGRVFAIGAAAALVLTAVAAGPAQAAHPEVSLPGSEFEIDTDANLKVDDAAPPSLDWANVAESRKADKASGPGDDSFGQGSKEDTAVPSVVSGSIPPNKSDLLTFGTYLEKTPGGDFLHMFWHRVQEPSGTTNMDFEFNQSTVVSGNGVTPVRTAGDLLIQYDLSQGGTNPQLFLSTWVASGPGSQCEASNNTPCWSTKANLTAAGDATGSINTSPIPVAQSDGLTTVNPISPRTFGEASVDFSAIVGDDECVSFGSAYLKSRSSDSFTAALKDFIAPAPTDLNNCAKVIIRKVTDPVEDPVVTMFDYTTAFETETEVNPTFSLGHGGVQEYDNVFLGTGLTVTEETPPAGWDFDNVDCSASSGVTPSITNATVTFDLDANSDVLDCTYTNIARGKIIVEKITDDGFGAFEFTSGTLSPSPFTLTTTAAGAGGKDSETFSDLAPGTYDVSETVPTNWNLVSETCDDGSDPQAIGLSAGETVTCTFHDARERGAILITKTAKHADDPDGEIPHAGVTFTVTGGELPAAGVTAVTDANGAACVAGLVVSNLVGTYTVTETVPGGYHVVSANPQTAFVSESEGDCDPITPGASVAFENTPLTNLTVSVDSQIVGGTSSTIDCVPGLPDPDFTTPASGDGSLSLNNLEPQTVVCTIVIDP
ncbi:collagen binding domain-containing protein [Agromyces sp. Soil535]|uniref:MSCRAMM family protein n=1 Tax=Agromyces sp. Soil535 TaxID=1736390 RepID=UPI0006F6B9AE|nr:prealbumin-like fold domain-containing protein [Agromyces sp. Soil535]KRE21138.1 hypothetical protein ASG80_13845 [Agromyces sp. Soil535]